TRYKFQEGKVQCLDYGSKGLWKHSGGSTEISYQTNNSSIVSKRSVERLYYQQPHFYRYFVKKPIRRSPLINRGYWLRMYVVDDAIGRFLAQCSRKKKVILNLGCGYDPLVFQWLSKSPELSRDVTFIDIDYPELMAKKCEVIAQTRQLRDLIEPIEAPTLDPSVFLRSRHFLAIGCDLSDSRKLGQILTDNTCSKDCLILCIAEVSITYMNDQAADAVLEWAAQYEDVRFCLLEQFLPDGADHPFAQKMLQHFENLNTPLRSVRKYPRLIDQEKRFLRAGWKYAKAKSLWNIFCDLTVISNEQKLWLNTVEPFDEYEEFVLFASHYFYLEAAKSSQPIGSKPAGLQHPPFYQRDQTSDPMDGISHLKLHFEALPKLSGCRRFGAIFPLYDKLIGYHGGLGSQSRLNSLDVYKSNSEIGQRIPTTHPLIKARMCHTITTFADDKVLLVGGRTSPSQALSDCWLLSSNTWTRVEDLPAPLYRHCATSIRIREHAAVLIYGGKNSYGHTEGKWHLWWENVGWVKLIASEPGISPRFGASLTSDQPSAGFLLGGMTNDCNICDDVYHWTIRDLDMDPRIQLTKINKYLITPTSMAPSLYRFGAHLTSSFDGLLLIGGVSNQFLPRNREIIKLSRGNREAEDEFHRSLRLTLVDPSYDEQRPLLVGHASCFCDNSTALVGGGALCFSFGTYLNERIWTLRTRPKDDGSPGLWDVENIRENKGKGYVERDKRDDNGREAPHQVTGIPRTNIETTSEFERLLRDSRPAVIEGLDLGPCVRDWSLDALKAKIGSDRMVVVHEAANQHMNFKEKNFVYVKKAFGSFINDIHQGSRQYLRSLAADKPSERPANLKSDFKELASDFVFPHQLEFVQKNAHSSPLRISGPVNIWLHYDVMANVLCQIRGSKRVIMFPPEDVSFLEIDPGASSSSINVFETDFSQDPALKHTNPYETILQPGEVLFIPPVWMHSVSPLENLSVSVNVFFRNLKSGYATGRDIYGNRDIQAYEKGRKDVEKILKTFEGIPTDMRDFYLLRLGDELKAGARA
ncbi:MAG: hypothetical protein Q9214_000160, partial [Letrouitia sp. 1 TL-2023]